MAYIYREFLEDSNVFDEAQSYWEALFSSVVCNVTNDNWGDWFNNVTGDGNKNRSGNPILIKRLFGQDMAVRIIQEEPYGEDDKHFSAWINYFDDKIRELVISTVLTEKNAERVNTILNEYINNRLSDIDMQKIIDDLYVP